MVLIHINMKGFLKGISSLAQLKCIAQQIVVIARERLCVWSHPVQDKGISPLSILLLDMLGKNGIIAAAKDKLIALVVGDHGQARTVVDDLSDGVGHGQMDDRVVKVVPCNGVVITSTS